jgi:hypothetical protein
MTHIKLVLWDFRFSWQQVWRRQFCGIILKWILKCVRFLVLSSPCWWRQHIPLNVGRHSVKNTAVHPRRFWASDLKDIGCKVIGWNNLAQVTAHRWTSVNTKINLRSPQMVGNFLTSWVIISFLRRTTLHGNCNHVFACSHFQACYFYFTFCIYREILKWPTWVFLVLIKTCWW